MATQPPTIFLTSATGSQGLNLARLLRSQSPPWPVHATVRSLTSPAAIELASLGVSLTRGSWDDLPAISSSLQSCTALFLNLVIDFTDFSHELTQARNILSLAKTAGVKQVVYSSAAALASLEEHFDVDKDGSPVMVASLKSKQVIEEEIKNGTWDSWTILRGANFMENMLDPKVAMYPGLKESGVLRVAFKPGEKLPFVATADIAKFALEAFKNPAGRLQGKEVNIVGDELTPEELMELLGKAAGREMRFQEVTDEEVQREKENNPFITAGLAVRVMGRFMKKEETENWGMGLMGFEEFLKRNEDGVKATYS
ncbi:hypothetical protein QBC40DRAFT_290406 [Triangularia verruculosa]|uniref:NmrA-like domain-containing protein n=1 Tax=Triangularia verruculosa TaxID=2587418 RepID=A0AAN6X5U2_9PEZI|nr:hypothetical protein QBC40DRAFT_290406 [Triangularia verruculosa]